MKKILIGTLVGAIIYFAFQSAMWMGGMHNDFSKYSPKCDTLLTAVNANLNEDGMYTLPGMDMNKKMSHAEAEAAMKAHVGKPWAMIFYHKAMSGMEGSQIMMGFLHAVFAALFAAMVLYYGGFTTFGSRFLVAYSFALFTLVTGIMNDVNWWEFPWHFIKAKALDIMGGWLLASIWLGWYMKKPASV